MATDYSHGVQYTPATVQSFSLKIDSLQEKGIGYIRLQWVDLVNNVRYRVIPVTYFKKMLQSSRPSVALAKAGFGLVYLHMAEGFSASGEYLYVPDLSTLKICPYSPGHASVMGWLEEKAAVIGPDGGKTVKVDLCPRSALRRVVEEAKATSGAEFLVGFETEFILLKSTDPVEAVNVHSWSATDGLPSGSVEATVLQEIADAVQASGIELQMYHSEAAPGQYEIVTGPALPLQSVDNLVHTREIITNIAAAHGLRATYAPRVYLDSAGSAAHVHISVHAPNDTPKTPEKLSQYESSFLAGLLPHLPAITAITLPIPASYKRMLDGVWSGGTYVCWGTENREAPIRLTNAASPSSRNFEIRFVDATANPYLALAAILGAASKGIQDKAVLEMKDCTGSMSAAQMSEEERRTLGITQRMSLTWEQSREKFAKDEVLGKVFGPEMMQKFLAVNKTLAEALDMDETDEAKLTRLVKFY